MTVKLPSSMVQFPGGQSLEDRLNYLTFASNYGAASGNSAASNTIAISNAISDATGASGFVVIGVGISYNEADLTIPDDVTLIEMTSDGYVKFISKDHGTSLPVTKGGLVIKSQGNNGVLLRNTDYGVTAEPFVQFLDAANGDLAAVEFKFAELTEITEPSAPSANKARLFIKDDGASNSQLMVRFATGTSVAIATQGKGNLTGSTTWDPGSIANGAREAKDITVSGAVLGDLCVASFSLDLQDMILSASVTATDTVTAVIVNNTGGAVDLSSGTVKVVVLRNY